MNNDIVLYNQMLRKIEELKDLTKTMDMIGLLLKIFITYFMENFALVLIVFQVME